MSYFHWLGQEAEWFHAVQLLKGEQSFEIEADGFVTLYHYPKL